MLDFLDGDGTRASKRTVRDCYLLGENSATRASDSDGDNEALFYLFNFDNDEGFAIVGADTRLPTDIFAITESGNIDPEVEIDNPGLGLFLMAMSRGGTEGEFLKPAPGDEDFNNPGPPNPTIRYEYSNWTNKKYDCLRSGMKWYQGNPYNFYTPRKNGENCLVGCVAVAVAQLMSCWEYPYHYDGFMLNWEQIKKEPEIEEDFNPIGYPVPWLLGYLGSSDLLDMNYGLTKSGADPKKIPKVMKAMGYSKWGERKHYTPDRVNTELMAGYPILVSGSSEKINVLGIKIYPGGHTWLVDELLERTRYKYTYTNGNLTKTETQEEYLVYCNWGWKQGSGDGYYYHNVFNANDDTGGPEDITRTAEDSNYPYELRAYVGIRK